MRFRVATSAVRLTGSVLRSVIAEVADGGRATLIVDGEPLATFASLDDLRSTFSLEDADLELVRDSASA